MTHSVEEGHWVHFAERRGGAAALCALAQAWASLPGFLSAEVLHSPAQADSAGELVLLVTRWQGAVPPLELPAGTRGWAFQVMTQPRQG